MVVVGSTVFSANTSDIRLVENTLDNIPCRLHKKEDRRTTYSRAHLKMGQWGKVRLSAFK